MADNRNKMIYGRDVVGKRRPDKSAVALEYTLHDKAPKVIASGKGYLAEKIIDKANEEDIPVHKDEKLAKSLENIEIGEYIPPELYQVVAEVLVFVDAMDKIKGKVMDKKENNRNIRTFRIYRRRKAGNCQEISCSKTKKAEWPEGKSD